MCFIVQSKLIATIKTHYGIDYIPYNTDGAWKTQLTVTKLPWARVCALWLVVDWFKSSQGRWWCEEGHPTFPPSHLYRAWVAGGIMHTTKNDDFK